MACLVQLLQLEPFMLNPRTKPQLKKPEELTHLRYGGSGDTGSVRENLNLYAAILCTSGRSPVGGNFLILADSNQVELVGRHVEFGSEILHHSLGSALA